MKQDIEKQNKTESVGLKKYHVTAARLFYELLTHDWKASSQIKKKALLRENDVARIKQRKTM